MIIISQNKSLRRINEGQIQFLSIKSSKYIPGLSHFTRKIQEFVKIRMGNENRTSDKPNDLLDDPIFTFFFENLRGQPLKMLCFHLMMEKTLTINTCYDMKYNISDIEKMELEHEEYAGEYEILSLLGEGGQAMVYLGNREQNKFALKVYNSGVNNLAAYQKEVQMLSLIDHKHLIKMIDHSPAARFKRNKHPEEQRPLVVLELAEGGELFDFIAKTGRFSEELARTFVKQLIAAVKYLHSVNITHRDLKPENILFDKNFILKVSDFGLARDARGNRGDYELTTCVGTTGYRAPQVFRRSYEGLGADLFAIGVILFILYNGNPPFLNTNDRIYTLIRNNNYAQFWQLHQSRKPPGFYSNPFKRLINCFLCADPQRRPSFSILESDEWMNGPTLTQQEVFKEMSGRAIKMGKAVKIPKLQQTINQEGGSRADLTEDENNDKQKKLAHHFSNITILSESLPHAKHKDVTYVSSEPRIIISWLHYYLQQQRQQNHSFIDEFVQDIKFLRFEVNLNKNSGQLALKLAFEVQNAEQTDVLLFGQLHRSPDNMFGIKWKKQEGHTYWLSEIQAQIDASLALIS